MSGQQSEGGLVRNGFLAILISVLLVILVSPVLRSTGNVPGMVLSILLTAAIPLASVYTFFGRTRILPVLVALGVLFVVFGSISTVTQGRTVTVLNLIFAVLLYAIVIVLNLRHMLTSKTVTANLVYGAISTYLLVGIMWAALYMLVEIFAPGSISGLTDETDVLYFSLVTLTTVGYGDVSPASVLARRLAVLEAGMGAIYIGVIIALIVGKFVAHEMTNQDKDKPES